MFGELGAHDPDDFLDVLLALFHLLRDPFGERREDVRIERFEAQIFQFGPHPADAQPIGERRIDFDRFLGDFFLLRGIEMLQGPHVMQAVRQLDQDHPDVVRHRDDHLTKILGLLLFVALEVDLADLGDAVDQAGDVLPELFLDLLLRADGVFDRIVEQARDDGRNVESERGHDLGDSQRMLQVRLSGLPHLALMRLG